jgi:adenosylcobinamide-GDP ribazoletransferase
MLAASGRAAAGAFTFLTRVPLARLVVLDGDDVARGSILFPVVGAGVGAAGGGVALLVDQWLPAFTTAALACTVTVLVTGAMHVDALADTADALGAPTRERALEVMRDSRIGSFGAAAIALDLLLKVSAVAALVDRGGVVGAFVAAGALSRSAAPLLAARLPYPRAAGGTGSVLTGRVTTATAVIACAIGLALTVLAVGADAWPLAGTAAIATVALALWYRAWLGGATGDSLGATTEVIDTAVLVVAAALA